MAAMAGEMLAGVKIAPNLGDAPKGASDGEKRTWLPTEHERKFLALYHENEDMRLMWQRRCARGLTKSELKFVVERITGEKVTA